MVSGARPDARRKPDRSSSAALSIAVGVIGLVAWLAALPTHRAVRARRAKKLQPAIDRSYETVHHFAEEA